MISPTEIVKETFVWQKTSRGHLWSCPCKTISHKDSGVSGVQKRSKLFTRLCGTGALISVPQDEGALNNLISCVRALSNRSWNTSRNGTSTASLGHLCQCLVTLIVNNFFHVSHLSLHSFQCGRLFVCLFFCTEYWCCAFLNSLCLCHSKQGMACADHHMVASASFFWWFFFFERHSWVFGENMDLLLERGGKEVSEVVFEEWGEFGCTEWVCLDLKEGWALSIGCSRGVLRISKTAYYHLFLTWMGEESVHGKRTHLLALKSSQRQITAQHFGEEEDIEKFSKVRTKNSFYKPGQQ